MNLDLLRAREIESGTNFLGFINFSGKYTKHHDSRHVNRTKRRATQFHVGCRH